MRLVKAFVVGIIGLSVFITLLSLLIPAHPSVSRTVVINTADKNKIEEQVFDWANWKNWHPVFTSGAAKIVLGKVTRGGDASCEIMYNNKTIRLKVTRLDSSSVTFLLQAPGENDISNQVFIHSMQALQQTRVDWVATTHLHWYPWEKFYAIFIDKLTGPGYEAALAGLKKFIESK
jgi:hypothetical protein